jgi:hypothetical protein
MNQPHTHTHTHRLSIRTHKQTKVKTHKMGGGGWHNNYVSELGFSICLVCAHTHTLTTPTDG